MSVLNLNYMTVIQMLLGLCFSIGNVHKCTFEIDSLVNVPGEIWYTKVAIKSIDNVFVCLHSMARANLNKSKKVWNSTTTASKYIPKRPRICIN